MPELTVGVKRVVKAPIERVFKAWTDPQQMMQWYGPEGMTTPYADSDNHVGGTYHVTMQSGERQFKQTGEYLEFDEPNKIVFTWGDDTRVSVEFRRVDEQSTEVSLTHTGFLSEASREEHDQGWASTLRKLEKHVG